MDDIKKYARVTQKVIIYNDDGQILTLRRSVTAPTYSLNWDFPGGNLDYGEDMKQGIIREAAEEAGVILNEKDLCAFDAVSGFSESNDFWVTICYKAHVNISKVTLSYEHDDFKWVKPDEFLNLSAAVRNKKFVEKFKNLHAEI